MTFFIAIFVLLMQWLWKYIDDLVGKGLSWGIITQLLFWSSTTMVPLALPLAILLSSIMTFGNLGEHYELVALKSSGISLQRIMSPLIFTTVLICILAFYFSNNVLPYANLKMGALLYDVQEQKPALNIKEGIFYYGIDDYVIKVGKKDKDGITVHDVMIYDHTDRMGNINLTIAEGGTMQMTADKRYLIFTLNNGTNYLERIENKRPTNNHPFQRIKFKDEFRRFDLSAFTLQRTNEEFFKDNYHMMNLHQLTSAHDSLEKHLDSLKVRCTANLSNNLYYFHAFCKKDTVFHDTLKPLKNGILDNFDKKGKNSIIEKALNMARGIKDFAFYNNEDFEQREKFIARNDIEWHRKFTLSIGCLVLFFIGAPLGAIIRKGGLGLPLVISVVFFVIYHVISFTCEKMSREGIMPPYIGMWVPSLVFLPVGVFLTYKATGDSSLFDVDAYLGIFRRVFRRKQNAISN
jgi:lipopolysaccharide export system permease protein